MKKKILLITVNRSDFGIQRNLIKKLSNQKNFEFKLLVTGTHLSCHFGYTIDEIKEEKIKSYNKIKISDFDYKNQNIINLVSSSTKKFYKYYKKYKPDLVIILGDRYEMFSAVIPLVIMNIPIVHIHGGEKTEGSFDDIFRHMITTCADLHFVCHNVYKKRVSSIKGDSRNIYNFGSLSLEDLNKFKLKKKIDIEKKFNIIFKDKNILITYHPETKFKGSNKNNINILFKAIDKFKDINFIFTISSPDPGNKDIIKKIENYCNNKKNCYYVKSFGKIYYFSTLKIVDAVLGNSSSGILEVPSFKKTTINIGDRQLGRLQATSIINCKLDIVDIEKAIKKVYSKSQKKLSLKTRNIFYKKNTSNKIITKIKSFLNNE